MSEQEYKETLDRLANIDDETVDSIIDKADIDGNKKMDFMDFMMAAVDLSENQFIKYLERAYEIFFNNDIQQVDKQEFIERVCMQNIKKQLVEIIISEIDENQNESITFDEFVSIFLIYNKDRMP